MKLFNNEFIKGSLILLFMFNFFNLLNLIFQIFTARHLSLEDYGTLAALLSVVYLFAIFSESIQLAVAKQTSSTKSLSFIRKVYDGASSQALKLSTWIFVIYCILFITINVSLKIPIFLLFLNGLIVFFAFLTPIARGVLQGQKRFFSLGLSMILEGASKLLFAVILILIGLKVYGVILAMILSMALPLIYARYFQLKNIFSKKASKKFSFSLIKDAPKVFLIMTTFILFFMLDSLIAKIVFPSDIAGTYAIISTISKTLFIGTQPISKAFFPISVNKKNIESKKVFLKAAIMIGICLSIALIGIYFFSDQIINLFSGKDLGVYSSSLIIVALANSVLAFTNLLLFYRISNENYNGIYLFFSCVIIQIIALLIFNTSIFSFSLAFLCSTVMFLATVLYKIK